MSAMDRVSGLFNRPLDLNMFSPERLKANELTPAVMAHLSRVYTTMALGLVVCGAGTVFDMRTGLGGMLSFIGGIALLFWMAASDPADTNKRIAMFGGFCFLQGMNLGTLVSTIMFVDPSIITTALLGTTTVFVCFTVATLLAKRRSMLYLGGMLSSAISWLFLGSLLNMFFRSQFLMDVQLYMGLLVFCGYVLFDTEVIIAKAKAGSTDFVMHAVELFIDFVAIFVRLAIILLRNSGGRKKKERR